MNIHITYNHTSHASQYNNAILSSGAMFQEILTAFIVSMICDIEVVYHESWKYCKFISYESFKYHTITPLKKYDCAININYYNWNSISFKDLTKIKQTIDNCKSNTLIVLNNVSLINPSCLYKWFQQGYLRTNIYSDLFLPKLRNMYFYDRNSESNGIYIHIRTGDIGQDNYNKGLDLEYYTKIINIINNYCKHKIFIVYEGVGSNTTSELIKRDSTFDYLWPRELKKLNNVILKEGNLQNINEQINMLCNAKYLILSPSTFSYYAGMISTGIKFVDNKIISMKQTTLRNTTDLPQFITYDDFSEVVHSILMPS